jgi:hypothetical protein
MCGISLVPLAWVGADRCDPYGTLYGHRGKVWLILSYSMGYTLGKIPGVFMLPSLLPKNRFK